jgi:hypothetical protein
MANKISKSGIDHIALLLPSSLSDKELTSCISGGEGLSLNSDGEFIISEDKPVNYCYII